MRGWRAARLAVVFAGALASGACGASTPASSTSAPVSSASSTMPTATATSIASATTAAAASTAPRAKLDDAIDVAVGREHACAARRDHSVVCWGKTGAGATKPTLVVGMSRAEKIFAGQGFTCALDSEHHAWCWGANEVGQLGTAESKRVVSEPSLVMENGKPLVAFALALGAFHACAVSAGAVHCWGDDSRGQTHTGASSRAPARVPGTEGALAVAAGALHTCAIVDAAKSRKVSCWGTERPDRPGAQAVAHGPLAVSYAFATPPEKIAASMQTSCVLDSASNVVCWEDTARSASEQLVTALSTSGTARALAVSGTTCWTIQHDGGVAPIYKGATGVTPTQRVAGVSDVIALGAGGDATCAARRDGSVTCWGDNRFGQLGDGTTNATTAPVAVIAP